MFQHQGGRAVKLGYYVNRSTWDITVVPREGGVLPGTNQTRYVRVPILAFFFFAPLMGALYVIFLPLIGFALVFQHLSRKAVRGVQQGWTATMAALGPAWRPGLAYFADKGRSGEKDEARGDKTEERAKGERRSGQ